MTIKKIIVRHLSSSNLAKSKSDVLNDQLFALGGPIDYGQEYNHRKPAIKKQLSNNGKCQEKDQSSLRTLWSTLAAQSNVHGVSCIVGNKSTIFRLFWTLAFLALLGFAVFQLYTIGTLFYSYPVKTKVKMEFKPLPFPAITICNMNTIRHSKIYDINSTVLQDMLNNTERYDSFQRTTYQPGVPTVPENYPFDFNNYYYDGYSGNDDSNYQASTFHSTTTASHAQTTPLSPHDGPTPTGNSYNEYSTVADYWDYWNYGSSDDFYADYYYSQFYQSPLDHNYVQYERFKEEYLKIDREQKKKVGHQLKNMLLECQFNGRKCEVPIKDVVTYDYGNCFTIQSPMFIAGSTGPLSGMVLTVNLENHEAIEGLTEGYGMRMVIHEQKSFPLPLEEGITISAGYETSIGLKMSRIERKGYPYGKCIDGREYFQENKIRYSTQACIQQCWEQLAHSACGCVVGNVNSEINHFHDQADREFKELKGCFDEEDKRCSFEARRLLLADVEKHCNCPQPCLENVYTKTFSGRIWPHQTKLYELLEDACNTYESFNATGVCDLNSWNHESLRNNFLKVNIYFEDLNYEVITEEPLYDATQLISDVGGSMGLCLGASLLCMCEVFEALILTVLVLYRKLRGHNSVRQANLRRMSLNELRISKA